MPNATPTNGTLIRMLANYGVAGIMLAVVSGAFWCVALEPMKTERSLLVDTLRTSAQSNSDAVRKFAGAISQISTQMEARRDTFDRVDKSMREVVGSTQATAEALNIFAEEVRRTHPEQTKKLDEILQQLQDQ